MNPLARCNDAVEECDWSPGNQQVSILTRGGMKAEELLLLGRNIGN